MRTGWKAVLQDRACAKKSKSASEKHATALLPLEVVNFYSTVEKRATDITKNGAEAP